MMASTTQKYRCRWRPRAGAMYLAIRLSVIRLFADHDDRERARHRAAAATAGGRWRRARRRRRWRRQRFGGHREQMPGLAVERDRARTVRRPRLQVLHEMKRRAVETAGERDPRENLSVLRTENHE